MVTILFIFHRVQLHREKVREKRYRHANNIYTAMMVRLEKTQEKRDSPKPVGPRPMLVCFFLLPLFLFTNNIGREFLCCCCLYFVFFVEKRNSSQKDSFTHSLVWRRWIESSQQRTHTNKHTNKQTNKQTNTRNVCVCIYSFNASSSSRDGGTDEDTSRHSQFRRAQQR